jgi:phage tail tape-measure protein
MTWNELLARMRKRHAQSDERLGQAYFNVLYAAEPELADMVRATDADPFYADSLKDERVEKFFDEIHPYFV